MVLCETAQDNSGKGAQIPPGSARRQPSENWLVNHSTQRSQPVSQVAKSPSDTLLDHGVSFVEARP
ncbi:hypothetical protein BHQ20_13075 [Mycobacterium intermedium]|nr:hypothetical protein BHQ20_13075 [Mycobacterium intermedium]OPE50891.1 hypothetical protein BV508_08400 [Mycobacterium intermedium]